MDEIDQQKTSNRLEEYVQELITFMGDDPRREGLEKTPKRVVDSYRFLTKGYKQSIKKVVNGAIFEMPGAIGSEMVVVRNIEIYSLCEHHLLPFYGKCHVGYIPRNRVVGLSKVARIVDVFARRLQVQERLTTQVADCFMEHLNPLGVGVVIEASHLCMMMRGVEKQNATAKTSSLRGCFRSHATRSEFFTLIQQ